MTRAKNSFKGRWGYRPRIAGEIVQVDPEDVDLSPELADLVQVYRGVYKDKLPRAQDIRQTLLDLISDDDPFRAIESLDPVSDSLVSEALRKQSHAVKKLDPQDRVREAAQTARKKLKGKSWHPTPKEIDLSFARALVAYRLRAEGGIPVVKIDSGLYEESEFVSWAWQMFSRAGRQIIESTLAQILRQAILDIAGSRAV